MSRPLAELSAWSDEGDLNVVVESPRGSTVKLEYQPRLGEFTVARALPLGLAYPFDWGFIPGTLADDGDPVDALVLHQASTYPGIVLPCRVLGMVEIEQQPEGEDEPQINNRIIAVPVWHDPIGNLDNATHLSPQLRAEIEEFFINAARPAGKNPKLLGWQGSKAARKFIESHETTPKEPHMATSRHHSRKHPKRKPRLPEPGPKKKNPRELEGLLDEGLKESMAASDVPAVTQPEVHTEPDRDAESVESGKHQADKSRI